MVRYALCDTGFWIGLFDHQDNCHEQADILFNSIVESKYNLILPWPCLYEFLNSRFFRRKNRLAKEFSKVLNKGFIEKLCDLKYREDALNSIFYKYQYKYGNLSLVDQVIIQMLNDVTLNISALITFDPYGFNETCANRNIILYSN